MSDDLVRIVEMARANASPPHCIDTVKGIVQPLTHVLADQIEAQADEITRLRAAINDALTAPWPVPELNSTWHQEPIGPNETPEEAIKRLVNVRAEWAVYKNNCENAEIAELRAALATARREGMEEATQMIIDLRQETTWEEHPEYGQICVIRNRTSEEIAAAIRAAAKEGEP